MSHIQFDQEAFDKWVAQEIEARSDLAGDRVRELCQRSRRFFCYITCSCGKQVSVAGFTNRCDCGKFYNWAGQQLSHPSFWGEETGERFDNDGQPIL